MDLFSRMTIFDLCEDLFSRMDVSFPNSRTLINAKINAKIGFSWIYFRDCVFFPDFARIYLRGQFTKINPRENLSEQGIRRFKALLRVGHSFN